MIHSRKLISPACSRWSTKLIYGLLGIGLAAGGSQTPLRAFPVSTPLWGPTGLGIIPTTDTVPQRQAEVSASYEKVNPNVGDTKFGPVLTANYGLRRAELGAGYLHEHTTGPGFEARGNYLVLHGKYRLYESAKSGAALAVGGHYLDFRSQSGHVTSLYLVGSYPLWRDVANQRMVRAHLGVIQNRIHSGVMENDTRPMGGLDWAVTPQFTLAADYTPRRGASTQLWSVVGRYQRATTNNWGAEIGYGKQRGSDNKFFVGLSYRFGK